MLNSNKLSDGRNSKKEIAGKKKKNFVILKFKKVGKLIQLHLY